MMDIIPSAGRRLSDHGWLKSYFLFSFGDYYDPENLAFGSVRVFNDDTVAPQSGFPAHPHANYEIVTIVLSGEITHQDTMGTRQKVKAGEVQAMTAGTGVEHSEFNMSGQPLHLYQIWIKPSKQSLKPSYSQASFKPSDWKNTLLPVASGQGKKGAAKISADATIYRCELEKGKGMGFQAKAGRCIFIYPSSGSLEINSTAISANDQARISGVEKLALKAKEKAHFVLIDCPA